MSEFTNAERDNKIYNFIVINFNTKTNCSHAN